MRWYRLSWVAAALLTTALDAQWRDLQGTIVPKISAEHWFNTDGTTPTSESLRGKVWLLQFFATWSKPCMRKVEILSILHEKYYEHGFRVIAVSDEVRKKLELDMAKRSPKYWYASDPKNTTQARFVVGGQDLFVPRYYLVDAKGVIVSNEVPTEDRIIELLGQACVELEHEMPEALKKAERAFRDGAYGDAWQRAGKAGKSVVPIVQAEAGFLQDKVVQYAAFVKATSPAWLEGKRPEQVYAKVLLLSLQFEGLDLAKWAEKKLKEWDKEPAIKKDKKAWRLLGQAIERDLGSVGDDYERKRAKEMYQKVIDRHPYTRATDFAKLRLERFADIE